MRGQGMNKNNQKQILYAILILVVFIILWIGLYFLMVHESETVKGSVSKSTLETELKNTYPSLKKEQQEDTILYQVDDHVEIYGYEQEGAISRILLVFDQETYQEETARTYLEQLLSIFLTDSERISEIVQQLIVFDEEEESLIVNDIVEDHYEFFTRIDQPKEKIVFYINDLNFE